MNEVIRIIGIDPGLRRTGFGVIESEGSKLRHVANGVVKSDARLTLAERLLQLKQEIAKVVAEHAPHEAAVEQTFVNKDPVATLKLGQARGIALLVPAEAGLPVGEYAPNKVKKSVVGAGHADKKQVEHMVMTLLPGVKIKNADAADALAVAICHAHYRQASGRIEDAMAAAEADGPSNAYEIEA